MAHSPPCSPTSPQTALPDELVEEILLRLPTEEPGYFVYAALVSKPWRCIISDPRFRRRYLELHRSPPLLGYIRNIFVSGTPTTPTTYSPRFLSTSTTACPFTPPTTMKDWRALDCRHGRILICKSDPIMELIVWDPITGDQYHLNMTNYPCHYCEIGAVLCAVDGCDHLDCHGGPFLVVMVGMDVVLSGYGTDCVACAAVYSSETGEWSDQVFIEDNPCCLDHKQPSLLIGDALYFTLEHCISVLKYDLSAHALSIVDPPRTYGAVVTIAEDGGLGFVSVDDERIYMWSSLHASEESTVEW
ncbi:hypothetical protein PR202_ga28511 [Eleusine coracana subsp. coracana]|uniref:F-box domain-containing protein n=1 Tax=Eleusine coracana subsp. coracana TaxID=191504 RepID=A0AAV5DKJ0_ELECO|nr:hypothetical protein PR202_ga28511 [Eleusine coracana subsp. coracana]